MAGVTNQQLLDSVTQTLQGLIDVVATRDDVRNIVREETADIRDEQLRQGELLDDHTALLRQHAVIIEDMDGKISSLAELVGDSLALTSQTKSHDKRLSTLESKEKLIISTVRHHSAQIKGLQAGQK